MSAAKKMDFLVRAPYALMVIVGMHLAIGIWSVVNIEVYSDAAFHLPIIREIAETGDLQSTHPLLYSLFGFPRFMPITVNYPPLYYVLCGYLYPLFGIKVGAWLELMGTTVLILLIFLIFRKLYNERVGLLSALIVGLSPAIKWAGWDQAAFVLPFGMLAFYTYLRILDHPKLSNLLVFSLSVTALVGIFQPSYMFILAILLHFVVYTTAKRRERADLVKALLPLALLIAVGTVPVACYQIGTVGTLSTHTVNGWPVVDDVLHPDYLDVEDWQRDIDQKVDIHKLERQGEQYYYEINPRPWQLLARNPASFVNHYFNIFAQFPLELPGLPELTLPLLLFGGILFASSLNWRRSSLLFIMGLGLIPYCYLAKVSYYPYTVVLLSSFFALSLYYMRERWPGQKLFPVVTIVVALLALGYSIGGTVALKGHIDDRVAGPVQNLRVTGEWLRQHTAEDDKIMGAKTSEFPYYTNRTVFWDYRLFFLPEDDVVYHLKKYYKPKYVWIYPRSQLAEEWNDWREIPADSPFLDVLQDEELFMEVYNDHSAVIYQFVALYPLDGG
ncbi:MAG: hypothetical protein DRI40_04580 [Chloroflexi bacterium]|nr:MAG: hypothetical protein DRI40_04580 [Chloroflexota bacterium]